MAAPTRTTAGAVGGSSLSPVLLKLPKALHHTPHLLIVLAFAVCDPRDDRDTSAENTHWNKRVSIEDRAALRQTECRRGRGRSERGKDPSDQQEFHP